MAGEAIRCGEAMEADGAAGLVGNEVPAAPMGGVVVGHDPVGFATRQHRQQPARPRRADHGAHVTIPLVDVEAEGFSTDCVELIASDELEQLSKM